ncbi:uncharacterized protein LOC112570598 isoform X2 [Pomacea canaliculata]|uniref:uncharacterized protein LOC112570598 isoform X2 n=1 Tax=Pomacea canaliculata TaxID=400727 RepID=UPI000D739AEA|nr:uncharacterized protein LOC112570598 isoform X2 [Pomacea canaliculata]
MVLMAYVESYIKCNHFIILEHKSYYEVYVNNEFVWFVFTGSAIATEDQAMIMQQMTEEIQENCNILADAINFDMPEENDTVAGSSLPKTSTPKRPFRSIENSKDSHTAK